LSCMIPVFRCYVDEIYALLGCYSAYSVPTFRDDPSVPSSSIRQSRRRPGARDLCTFCPHFSYGCMRTEMLSVVRITRNAEGNCFGKLQRVLLLSIPLCIIISYKSINQTAVEHNYLLNKFITSVEATCFGSFL
jgi:hypothetical protein